MGAGQQRFRGHAVRPVQQVGDGHARGPLVRALAVDGARDRDPATAGLRHGEHAHHVAVLERDAPAIAVEDLREVHVHEHPVHAGRPLVRREDAVDPDAADHRVGVQPAREPEQVPEPLVRRELVGGRAPHGALDPDARAGHRDEHEVALLEADVARADALDQVVVQVERGQEAPTAADGHVAERADRVGAAGQVQGGERGPERGQRVRPRPLDVTRDDHLVGPDPGDRQRELCGGLGAPPQPRVDAPQPAHEHRLDLVERQPVHRHRPHVRDDDGAFPRHVQGVGRPGGAGQDHRQLVPGADPVVGRDGAARERVELGARPAEQRPSEDRQAADGHDLGGIGGIGAPRWLACGVGRREPLGRHADLLQREEEVFRRRERPAARLLALDPVHVHVHHGGVVAGRGEASLDLLPAHPGRPEALQDLRLGHPAALERATRRLRVLLRGGRPGHAHRGRAGDHEQEEGALHRLMAGAGPRAGKGRGPLSRTTWPALVPAVAFRVSTTSDAFATTAA